MYKRKLKAEAKRKAANKEGKAMIEYTRANAN